MLIREGWGAHRNINPLAQLYFSQSGTGELTWHAVEDSKVKILVEPKISVVLRSDFQGDARVLDKERANVSCQPARSEVPANEDAQPIALPASG